MKEKISLIYHDAMASGVKENFEGPGEYFKERVKSSYKFKKNPS